MKNHLLSLTQIAALRKRFESCKTQILALDWVTQGSLSQSPQGNWRWTRKVKAKTVTVALSDQQAELFRRAIDDHRKLEKLIDQMRDLSRMPRQLANRQWETHHSRPEGRQTIHHLNYRLLSMAGSGRD